MLTSIEVENTTISGFKRINMIVGKEIELTKIILAVRIQDMGVKVIQDFLSNVHYSELDGWVTHYMEIFQDQQLFLTTQRLDVIKAYHDAVMRSPKYADDCTFVSIGRSKSGKLAEHFYSADSLQIYLDTGMEMRG